ncbi:MAG: outer membrane lipoprotein carrier protein LolA [Desulfobulbaceae bacterium]|nr:MAG: outer membrane lipoprotein carrier protein LolA [Desulfobulbaceae bacterium]
MNRLFCRVLPLFLLCFALLLQPAQALDAAAIAKRIQERYDAMSSLRARFEQHTTLTAMRGRDQQGSGVVVIQKPDQLRWDYEEPSRQVLVCDGEEVSFYLEKENQLIVSKASAYLTEDLTYAFFTGTGDLLRDFIVEDAPAEMAEPGSYCLRLTPRKSHAQVRHLFLWVDETSFELWRLRIVDHLESITDIRFSDIEYDQHFADSYFLFVPPKGTEIILQ